MVQWLRWMFVWLQTSHFLYHLIFWNGYVTGMYQRELFQLKTYVFCYVGQYSWDVSVFISDENIALLFIILTSFHSNYITNTALALHYQMVTK